MSRLQSRVAELRVRAQADAEIEQQTRTFLEVRSHQCPDHIHRCSASRFIISWFRLQKWGWRKLRTSWRAYRRGVRPLWISSVKMTSPSNCRRRVLSSTASAIASKELCRCVKSCWLDCLFKLQQPNTVSNVQFLPEARAAQIWFWKCVITKTHKVELDIFLCKCDTLPPLKRCSIFFGNVIYNINISAGKQLIASKIKVFDYIIHVCVLYIYVYINTHTYNKYLHAYIYIHIIYIT